jgi:hypothetical protein
MAFDQVHQRSDSDCLIPAYPMMCDFSNFGKFSNLVIPIKKFLRKSCLDNFCLKKFFVPYIML